ncbi:hypothetical protein M621_21760 [Serratia plymuthica S13]|uniref:Uncharacterized protein n=1 Tax=Serratia plymuthica S13 TaxID=1348660 RepID=S4YR96_SERPL|nr:hypothetical protein M621_21760 [Serratia plymuthica S13]
MARHRQDGIKIIRFVRDRYRTFNQLIVILIKNKCQNGGCDGKCDNYFSF